jgi:hypothetical protein
MFFFHTNLTSLSNDHSSSILVRIIIGPAPIFLFIVKNIILFIAENMKKWLGFGKEECPFLWSRANM